MAVTCHAGPLVQATKQLPSGYGSALSPSWAFGHHTEQFPALHVLVLRMGAAAPGDGVTRRPAGLQRCRISAGLPPAEVLKYQF